MLETVAEKKIPPPLPPKTRRGCLKNGDISGDGGSGGGGATILSSGHVVKIRIDPMTGGGGQRDDEQQPRRDHTVVGRRSSTVKINITCVDPFVFRRHYNDDDDDDDEDEDEHRRSLSGHQSPLDSGTGSDLDTGSRRDESDDGTCSCDSLTSSTADTETTGAAVGSPPAIVAGVVPAVMVAAAPPVAATVVEELPKRPPPTIRVKQQCYNDTTAVDAAADRIIDVNNTDQYYNFHMNENVFDEVDAAAVAGMDDSFAGCKTVVASDTIRSAKGTIRGVKNRVRAGIATFLQPKINKVSGDTNIGFFFNFFFLEITDGPPNLT